MSGIVFCLLGRPGGEAVIKTVPVTPFPRTNHASEHSLPRAVIWCKLSFGTESAAGSRFVETMLTVIESGHRQSRDAFADVTEAVEADFANETCSSLLPHP